MDSTRTNAWHRQHIVNLERSIAEFSKLESVVALACEFHTFISTRKCQKFLAIYRPSMIGNTKRDRRFKQFMKSRSLQLKRIAKRLCGKTACTGTT